MPVTLPNIGPASLRAQPLHGAKAVRGQQGKADFTEALRSARNETAERPERTQPEQKSSNDEAEPQQDATGQTRKRDSKDDKADDKSDISIAPLVIQQPANEAPLSSMLAFLTFRAADGGKAAIDSQQTQDKQPEPSAAITVGANSGIEQITTGGKSGDTSLGVATNERTTARGRNMTVPLEYYPILLNGMGWNSAAETVATSALPNTVTTAAEPLQAGLGTTADKLIVDTPAPEARTPELSPKDTAFALKLTGETPRPIADPKQSGSLDSPRTVTSGASIIALDAQAGSGSEKHSSDSQSSGDSQTYLDQSVAPHALQEKPVFTENISATRAVPADDRSVTSPNDPLRNILLQLRSDDNRRIDVRLVERAGELHVAVKSADPVLSERLQQHMPDLTSKLETGRVTAEVWMPKLTESQRSENGSTSTDTQAGTDGQPTSFAQSESGRRQQGQSHNRPDWVDLLENQIG